MGKSNLLRRSAEILAGLIIVVTTVVCTTVGIRNAGNTTVQLMSDSESENLNVNEDDAFLAQEGTDGLSSDDISSNMHEGDAYDNSRQISSTSGTLEYDNPQEITDIQSTEDDTSLQEQQSISDTVTPVYKYVNVSLLNVRKGPGSETEKVTMLPKATRVQCFSEDGEWVKITTDDNIEGYVFAEYLSDTAPPVYKFVIVNAVNIRKGPSTDTEKLGTISFGNKIQVFEQSNDYVRILTNDGVEGYVWNEYIGDEIVLASRSSSGQYYNSDLASKIIDYAKQFVGVPYVWGGSTPNGFDCSGFTWYVFKKFNINVPRTAQEYSGVGTKISRDNLKPGDVLLFDRNNDYRLGHVGIYLGNDKFIHASSRRGKVVITTLSKYGGNILGIRRVIK